MNLFIDRLKCHIIPLEFQVNIETFNGLTGEGENNETLCICACTAYRRISRAQARLIHIFRDGSTRYRKLFRRNGGRVYLQSKVAPFEMSRLRVIDIALSCHYERSRQVSISQYRISVLSFPVNRVPVCDGSPLLFYFRRK